MSTRILQVILPQRTIYEILRYMARKNLMLVMIVSAVRVVDDCTHSVVHSVIVAADRTSVLRWPRSRELVSYSQELASKPQAVGASLFLQIGQRPCRTRTQVDAFDHQAESLLVRLAYPQERLLMLRVAHSARRASSGHPRRVSPDATVRAL